MTNGDYLLHPEGASPVRREAVLCHEVSHMLLGHVPALHISVTRDLLATIAPTLAARVSAAVLFRDGYTDTEESAAEFVATVLAAALHERRAATLWETSSHLSSRLR